MAARVTSATAQPRAHRGRPTPRDWQDKVVWTQYWIHTHRHRGGTRPLSLFPSLSLSLELPSMGRLSLNMLKHGDPQSKRIETGTARSALTQHSGCPQRQRKQRHTEAATSTPCAAPHTKHKKTIFICFRYN